MRDFSPAPVQPRLGERRAKRVFDLLVAVPTLILLLPVLAGVALGAFVSIGRPVLFVQERPGYRERPFRLIKFRTMTNARDANGALLPDAERMTSFGRWLRATSFDELPELINVIRGEM